MKLSKILKNLTVWLLCTAVILGIAALCINEYVKKSTNERIITFDEAALVENADCILVLGCLVKQNGTPSDMLRDRLRCGVELYGMGAAPKILMSGDHGRTDYNEVQTMKDYAVNSGISSSDIFMDHAGFCTYDSIYRAKEVFGAEKIIIVTQKYHLHRALHIARQLGLEAYGVASDYDTYKGQSKREIREIIARNKDFVYTLFKPQPKYVGEAIPISGDGNITND